MTKNTVIYSFDKNKLLIHFCIIFLVVIGPIIIKSIIDRMLYWSFMLSSLFIILMIEFIFLSTYKTIYLDKKELHVISFTQKILGGSPKHVLFNNIKTVRCEDIPFIGSKLMISEYVTYKNACIIYTTHLDNYLDFEKTLLERIPKTCVVIGMDEEVKKYRK